MAYFRRNLWRERLDLVEYANAFGRGRKAEVSDFDPWTSSFLVTGLTDSPNLVTLWQWTVTKDSSRVLLITDISIVSFFPYVVQVTTPPTDLALDQTGFFSLQVNSNGTQLTPLVPAPAIMNRPLSFIFQPGVVIAIVGSRNLTPTLGTSFPATVNLNTSVSGYWLDPAVANRFSNMNVLQVAASAGPAGTKVSASSVIVY